MMKPSILFDMFPFQSIRVHGSKSKRISYAKYIIFINPKAHFCVVDQQAIEKSLDLIFRKNTKKFSLTQFEVRVGHFNFILLSFALKFSKKQ